MISMVEMYYIASSSMGKTSSTAQPSAKLTIWK